MSGSISPFPLVREGDGEHPVRTLQHLLRARNQSVDVDGIFGPKTDAAVRAFQMDNHLSVDGLVGPATWAELIVVVRRGSQGDAVKGVQEEFQFRNLSATQAGARRSTASSGRRPRRRCAPSSRPCTPTSRR